MSQNVRNRIHLIYGITLTAATLVAGICLIAACYGIYTAGVQSGAEQIYSRAIVAEAFSVIAVPVYLCLALTIGSFVLNLALPAQVKKTVPEKNQELILARLEAKTDLSQCDDALCADIKKQRKTRKLHITISAVVLSVCSIAFLIYACQPGRWPEDLAEVTNAVGPAVLTMLACLALPTGYCIFTVYYCRASLDKEIALIKQAAAQSPVSPAGKAPVAAKYCKYLPVVRWAVVAVAVALLVYGYCTGGIDDVIAKAAAICTECVGLG